MNPVNIAFVVLGLIFFGLEKLFPDRELDPKVEVKYDILAFILLILSGVIISDPLTRFYQSVYVSTFTSLSILHPALKVLLATLLTDFLNYWIHWYMHRSNLYWKTHVFHHQIKQLYWFSGLRASLGHYTSFILTRVTVGILIFRLSPDELFYYFTIGIATNFFQHTNSRLNHRWLEYILVTPRIHRLHHSVYGRRMKNLGTIFSFWDRMFGTYLDPEKQPRDFEMGVPKKAEESDFKQMIGI